MPLAQIKNISGNAVPVSGDNIDTDRIIPARFMKCVTFDGLGKYLFNDVRFDANGNKTAHNLNDSKFDGATIIVSGANFGCGSSREHAPQAIYHAGFRAVIAEGYAEIFFGNSTQLGIPCVSVSHDDRLALEKAVEADPQTPVAIDLEAKTITCGGRTIAMTMRESAREALVTGRWDPLADLMANADKVSAVAASLPYAAKA